MNLKYLNKRRSELPIAKQSRKFVLTCARQYVVFEIQRPCSTDFNSLDFYLWGNLKPPLYSAPVENGDTSQAHF